MLVRAERDLASDLGIAKIHHRQEFEYYCI